MSNLTKAREQEYLAFYTKAAVNLKDTDGLLETPDLRLTVRYNLKFVTGLYYIHKNLVVMIMGRESDPEEVKKKLLHELLHATYPELGELEIQETTESYWWAYKTGKFAV